MNAHYNVNYTRKLTLDDFEAGHVTIKMDPFRIADIHNISNGPRFQILKKVIRYTKKGHSEIVVLKEIICAAERRIAMIQEDNEN